MKSGQTDPMIDLKESIRGIPLTRTSFGKLYLEGDVELESCQGITILTSYII